LIFIGKAIEVIFLFYGFLIFGELSAALSGARRQTGRNAEKKYATLGLTQKWSLRRSLLCLHVIYSGAHDL